MRKALAIPGLLFLLMLDRAAAGYAVAPMIATVQIGDGVALQYFVSAPPDAGGFSHVLIAVHGYPRDATRTFAAAEQGAQNAGQLANTLIVAPIFQVPSREAGKCHWHGVPEARPTDALWHCDTWQDGEPALNASVTSFGAMDKLIDAVVQAHPSVHVVTIAGFSAGAQFVQHYVGFSNLPADKVHIRYVVADPGEFLYFDPERPERDVGTCVGYNAWKYGTDDLPAYLNRSAVAARAVYVAADIHYLEGAFDAGTSPGTAYHFLERNCAAALQGRYRLDRGEHYAEYDAAMLSHGKHPLAVVPDCKHNVTCILTSPVARAALFED